MRTARILGLVAVLLMAFFMPAYADDRPHEGKIVGIDTVSRQMLIQGERGRSMDTSTGPSRRS